MQGYAVAILRSCCDHAVIMLWPCCGHAVAVLWLCHALVMPCLCSVVVMCTEYDSGQLLGGSQLMQQDSVPK